MLKLAAIPLLVFLVVRTTTAFQSPGWTTSRPPSALFMSTKDKYKVKKPYEPKWKKKATLAEQVGSSAVDPTKVGLKGDTPVIFRQGNATCTTVAYTGQPLRDAASQAGQFIKYGCGKGECGTCEALVDGQWVRPCIAVVPAVAAGQDYTVIVKDTKRKAKSAGKFFTVKSFLSGAWNNLLGMVGMVRSRRAAKNSWQERKEYEDLIRQRTLERKRQKVFQEGGDMDELSP